MELTLAGMFLQQNRRPEALTLAESARNKLASERGVTHPDSVFASLTIAAATIETSPVEAEAVLREALNAWLVHLPENHLTVATIWNSIGAAQLAQRRPDDAVESDARALPIARSVAGRDSEAAMRIMYNYARSLKKAGRKKDYSAMSAAADRIRHEKGYTDPGQHTIDIRSLRDR